MFLQVNPETLFKGNPIHPECPGSSLTLASSQGNMPARPPVLSSSWVTELLTLANGASSHPTEETHFSHCVGHPVLSATTQSSSPKVAFRLQLFFHRNNGFFCDFVFFRLSFHVLKVSFSSASLWVNNPRIVNKGFRIFLILSQQNTSA